MYFIFITISDDNLQTKQQLLIVFISYRGLLGEHIYLPSL